MKVEDLKWSKTKVQCPHCEGWFTRQGILGHIRFRHSAKKEETGQSKITKAIYSATYLEIIAEYAKTGHLKLDHRETLLDWMLIDFLEKKAGIKR